MKSLFLLVDSIINIYIWVIIINVIINWLVAFNILNTQNRFVYILMDASYKLTSPLLNRIRRFIKHYNIWNNIDKVNIIKVLSLSYNFYEKQKKTGVYSD